MTIRNFLKTGLLDRSKTKETKKTRLMIENSQSQNPQKVHLPRDKKSNPFPPDFGNGASMF